MRALASPEPVVLTIHRLMLPLLLLLADVQIQVEACAAVIADPRVRAATVPGSVRASRAAAPTAFTTIKITRALH
jgi:hypothetical protein